MTAFGRTRWYGCAAGNDRSRLLARCRAFRRRSLILAEVLSRAVPARRDIAQLSFALANSRQLEHLLTGAGFRDVHVERQSREGAFDSLDDYWAPIEAGTGSIPQVYLSLPEDQRRAVRDEVTERLANFQSDGRLVMSVEMLIASGRA